MQDIRDQEPKLTHAQADALRESEELVAPQGGLQGAPIIVDLRAVIADLRQQAGHDVDLYRWTAVANYLEATKGVPDTESYPLRPAIAEYMEDVSAGKGKEPEVMAKREALQESVWEQGDRLHTSYGHGFPEFADADAEMCFYGLDEDTEALEAQETANKLALQARVEQAEEEVRLATERAEAAEAELAKLKQ